MWLEENKGKRINMLRTEDVTGTFCAQMLEEGIKKKNMARIG